MSIEDIFNCDPVELQNEHGFTLLKSIHLKELQDLIKNELVIITEDNNKLTIEKSSLLISSKIKLYAMSKIDEILIEDIEAYLWSLDEKQQNVALSRWGFNHDNEKLEEIGKLYGLTR
jgi:DNA-directed RNA polymerase sigma subunit (sigma70/sigma32)